MQETDIPRRLALLYARCADDRDFSAMREIITPGFTQRGPEWYCQGADAFVDQLAYLEANFSATLHMVGNQLGSWTGENYLGETYCVATHIYQRDGAGRKLEMGIRYRDDIVAYNGGHRYASRDLVVVWTSDQALQG